MKMLITWVHKLLPQISRGFVLGALALAALLAGSAQATTIKLGVIGDSYSDEYGLNNSRTSHVNYVQQLAAYGVNFGTYSGSNWDSVRQKGYEYNWAHSGYTTQNAIDLEYPGLNSQVASLDVAVISIGLNDFYNLFDTNSGSTISVVSTAYSNITSMVSGLLSTNPSANIVLANVPDWGDTHEFDGHDQTNYLSYNQAVTDLNNDLLSFANGLGIPVIDAYNMLQLINDTDFQTNGFGGLSVTDTSGANSDDFWADNAHPGSIYNGIFANAVLTALNDVYGYSESLLSAQQIWNYATGAASDPSVTVLSENEPNASYYVPYVLIPEPTSVLTLLGGGLVLLARRKR